MKKILLSFVLFLLTIQFSFAQRDTEHWIAPYYMTQSYNQALYLSTDSVTPFDVTIYSNNTVLGTVSISKGDPKTFVIPAINIAGNTAADAFKVINKGLYLNASKPFFCTMRMVNTTQHAEIVTSKGKAALGKEFFVAATPSTRSDSNFTAGILATEDNTTVTTTWNGAVTFIGGTPTGGGNSQTIILNKGQSFIFTGGMSSISGFIGAKIVADKNITLTNGNVNGNFGNSTTAGQDAILDQSVPVERLGSTFAMVRTRSAQSDLEGAIVIATKDNTQIFLNGSTTSVTTLNSGQWYRIQGDSYVQQGGSTHYNMLVTSSENVYVYQLVSVGTSSATGGFNFIPALNCFLPRKIDEIPKVNEMPTGTGTTSTVPSGTVIKLNILTEVGATVTVNGVAPTADQGPYPLTGNTNWVTYGIEGVTGNLTIVSNKAVTAGINGGYSTSGYGGYFAGFSSVPVISKQTGDCIPGIILEVNDGYDTYQWSLNGTAIPGATTHTYTPTTPGNYTCKVTMGSCTPVTTPIYKVFRCLTVTTKNYDVNCTLKITPTFTTSTQTPVPNTVTIITPPQHGTATIDPTTGIITYTPNPGYLGPDKIVYKFCGNVPEFTDCEEVTANFNIFPFQGTDVTINACQYNGKGIFNLNEAQVTQYPNPIKSFYRTMADLNAGINLITNPDAYLSTAPAEVFVKIQTVEGCLATAKITLAFYPVPVVQAASLSACFIADDEMRAKFNLTIATVSTNLNATKKYYATLADAEADANVITDPANYISHTTNVYVRVYDANNCYAIAKIALNVIPPKRSPLLTDKFICIDSRTTLDAGPGYESYEWSTGATTQSISGVGIGEYWVNLKFNGCITKQKVTVSKSADPVITGVDITNDKATVMVTGGVPPYKYSIDGVSTWQDSNVFNGLSRGQHVFYVKDALDCLPVQVSVTVPNLVNAITPNGDNVNDYVDYSSLSYKDNLVFNVYDRYGNKVFAGEKFNNFKWDGKHFDKKIVTGTYWYEVHWTESNAEKTPVKYTGWILVKNRD